MFIHKEYPKVLHKPGGLVSPEIHSDEERDKLIADGWSLRPVMDAPPVAEPVAAPVAEPVIEDAPKKRGRKPTVN